MLECIEMLVNEEGNDLIVNEKERVETLVDDNRNVLLLNTKGDDLLRMTRGTR